jgi:hypothetical protein
VYKFVCTYNVEDVFELLNYQNLNLVLDHLVEIQKQSTLEEAKELEPKLHNRTMMVSKFTERHGLTEASIKVFEATDVNKQQQLDKELHECLLTKRRFCRRRRGLCLARLQCLVSSSHLQGLIYCHLYC